MTNESVDWATGLFIVDTHGSVPGSVSVVTPPDSTSVKRSEIMSGDVDPVIEKMMDQNFVNGNRRMDEAGQRHVASAAFIDQQAQMGFMLSQQLFAAKAAGQLDRDSLAKSRLDAAAVGVKPAV